jgi:hypothetical protein
VAGVAEDVTVGAGAHGTGLCRQEGPQATRLRRLPGKRQAPRGLPCAGAALWRARDLTEAFVGTEPHLEISTRLDRYCDEATFVDWEQDSPDLPDWQTRWRHLVADGQVAELSHPSAANQTRPFYLCRQARST